MAAQGFLVPLVRVRILVAQPFFNNEHVIAPFLRTALFHLRRPDAAKLLRGHFAFQSSLAYRSTLRSSFKPICLVKELLAAFDANAAFLSYWNSPEGFSLRSRGVRSATRNPGGPAIFQKRKYYCAVLTNGVFHLRRSGALMLRSVLQKNFLINRKMS